MDFAALLTTEGLLALLTLTAMETVLGIDNVVFISVLCDRLPEARRAAARRLGLIAAMAMRVVLLFTIGWLTGLTEPLFALDLAVVHFEPSVRDLILAPIALSPGAPPTSPPPTARRPSRALPWTWR